jgi:Bifunctional DNA primase/polymerase, N-terminal
LELVGEGRLILPLHTPTARGCSCGRRCGRVGKHPRSTFGLKSATNDWEQVAIWWHAQPEANIGMRCDNLVAFDIDGPAGRRSLQQLEWELGELPPTRAQASGRGMHLFCALPTGVLIGNSVAPLGYPAGLDLRAGERGYVVVAPSLHESGRRYAWIDPEAPIAELPQPWLERLLALPRLPDPEPVHGAETSAYGTAVLRRELELLAQA